MQSAYKAAMDGQRRPASSISFPNNNSNSTQDSMTMDTMKDICARMAKEMGEAMMATLKQQPGTAHFQQPRQQYASTRDVKDRGWRQHTYYCWSCGCNSNHHSNQCKRRNAGHNEAATWENKHRGNTKRDWLWLKWVGPDNKTHLNKGDTQHTLKPGNNA